MAAQLGQVVLEDKLYLSSHVLYGSSRLGVKTYLPSQYQYMWNNSESIVRNTARLDSSDVAYRMPWYSGEHQRLVRYEATFRLYPQGGM